LKELWSLLHFILPWIFADFEEFSGWFNHPFDSLESGSKSRRRGRAKKKERTGIGIGSDWLSAITNHCIYIFDNVFVLFGCVF
jgi:hypothetical protein